MATERSPQTGVLHRTYFPSVGDRPMQQEIIMNKIKLAPLPEKNRPLPLGYAPKGKINWVAYFYKLPGGVGEGF